MFATLTSPGSSAGLTHTDSGRSERSIRSATIALLPPVLVAAQQLLAEVVVDCGVRAAAGRSGERDRRDAAPARRTSSSGLAPMKAASGVPQQKQ